VEVNEYGKSIKVLYKNQVIQKDGDRFRVYKDSNKAQVIFFSSFCVTVFLLQFSHIFLFHSQCKHLSLSPEQVKVGHKAWVQANTRSNAQKQAKRHVLKMEQKSEVVDVDTDLSDIHKLFEEKGQGSHLLEMEFEPVTDEAPVPHPSHSTGKLTIHWKHKLTAVEVRRYKSYTGKSWDTGVLSHYLRSLKPSTKNKVAYERAQEILKLNSKKCSMALKDTSEKQSIAREDVIKQWVSNSIFCGDSFVFCIDQTDNSFL
jgi:hypothetical protein